MDARRVARPRGTKRKEVCVMSFLDNLFKDPKYQTTDPRKPEEIEDPEIIISPDTRRE